MLLGIGLNFNSFIKGEIGSTFKHIISELNYQSVIISDSSNFEKNGINVFSWWKLPKLALSFMIYLLPTVAILYILSFGRLNMTICHPMKAPFLVDNTFVPANNLNFEELYRQRQGEQQEFDMPEFEMPLELAMAFCHNQNLAWNGVEFAEEWFFSFHCQQYWNFNNLNDLIKQYNFVGFHDVCNHPKLTELHFQFGIKGFMFLYPGYHERNNSGPNYKKNKIDTIAIEQTLSRKLFLSQFKL